MLWIFDLDGVLVNASITGLYEAYLKLIVHLGKEVPFANEEEFKKWWTPNWIKNEERLGIGPKEMQQAHEIFYSVYDRHVEMFPWTERVIKELTRKGHRVAIFTNRHSKEARQILGGFAENFMEIIGAEEVRGQLKPSPRGIYLILRRIGAKMSINLDNVIFVGDMRSDILAGRGIIKTGFACWGLGVVEEIEDLKPEYIFQKPEDILEIGGR